MYVETIFKEYDGEDYIFTGTQFKGKMGIM